MKDVRHQKMPIGQGVCGWEQRKKAREKTMLGILLRSLGKAMNGHAHVAIICTTLLCIVVA